MLKAIILNLYLIMVGEVRVLVRVMVLAPFVILWSCHDQKIYQYVLMHHKCNAEPGR